MLSLFGRLASVVTCGALLLFLASPLWAAGGGHGEGMPVKPLIFAAINFSIFSTILFLVLRKPVKEFFASRRVLISQDIEASTRLKQEAVSKHQDLESRLQNIATETAQLVSELKKSGELEKAKLVEEATAQAANLKKNTQSMMAQELHKAKEELKQESVRLASELAEALIKKNFNEEDQKRVVEKYLSKMEALA